MDTSTDQMKHDSMPLRVKQAAEAALTEADETTRSRIMEADKNLDRVRGCLFGGAAGDALGYPVEFMSEAQIRARFGRAGISAYMFDSSTGKALISDDTQMTLFTATGILVGNTRGNLRGIMGPLWSYAALHYEDWILTQELSCEEHKAKLRAEETTGHFRYQHSCLVGRRITRAPQALPSVSMDMVWAKMRSFTLNFLYLCGENDIL